MFDLLPTIADEPPAAAPAASRYCGPERRSQELLLWLVAAMLDEVDYGMLLVTHDAQVLHANRVARQELDARHALQLLGEQLRVRRPQDVAPLREALDGAARRGLRRMLTLGGEVPVSLAVVPLAASTPAFEGAVLVMFGKRQVCEALSVHWFARSHGLTSAEAAVLARLCAGERPSEVADRQGVAISTVRTQITSIRAKTRAASIRALVQQVAVLPPIVGALRSLNS
ncbi:helix-turn-helix transcriptional regulator [Ideonella sp. BN130291]|uniref:helix-turn-helix transcriptional regulator n=1 Tax=Ideonella sp. BN130291 TaxID=3112940 RepID=UPI002E26B2BC|nr:helix-turn-helix transcriptional regulator [Ideonella sp. BN130291]